MAPISTPSTLPPLRSLYRRILRELPPRQGTLLSTRTPLHERIRSSFASNDAPSVSSYSSDSTSAAVAASEIQQAQQILEYLRAQRMHTTLLERYNPGMGAEMSEQERVRLTARRVGLDVPVGKG